MSSKKAFPSNRVGEFGMSLREYFAGQALLGLLASPDPGNLKTHKHYAEQARIFADALITELES